MSLVLCCRDATARLTERSEGALAGAEGATFAFHLTICPGCKAYRAQLDTTVGVLRAMPREEPKAADVDAILRMLGDAAGTPDE
jgi:anti-sigma factor ChrR (cupin superfamily)